MKIAHKLASATLRVTRVAPFALAFLMAAPIAPLMAQTARDGIEPVVLLAADDASALPNAPVPQITSSAEAKGPGYKNVGASPVASLHVKYIPAGYTAQPITAHDKVLIGLTDLVNPLNFIAMVASAGYEQATNGAPNYGTDRGAFGQRLGAAAIRESTQGVFTDAVFAPLLREDPRYYVQGSTHGFVHRTLYAITRPIITRSDSGRNIPNAALLLGYASSTALSYTYYPKINQNAKDMASAYGGSIGGAALGFFVSEFSTDVLQSLHLKKR